MTARKSVLEKILVPLDGSELSERIVDQVRRLLLVRDAEVLLVHVIPSDDLATETVPGTLLERAKAHLDRVASLLRQQGARVATDVLAGEPASRLADCAIENEASLIVLSTHGRSGIMRWLRGSTAERLLRSAPCPVLVANPHGLGAREELRFRRILVPLDGSDRSALVIPVVRELALLYGSEVTLVSVIESPRSAEGGVSALAMTPEEAIKLLEPYKRGLEGIALRLVATAGSPAARILELVDESKFDLVAIATHGRSGIARWAFGSVAEKVVRHATCPLLVVRALKPMGSV